jgi:ATP-dependent DNA helicase RecG
VVLPPEIRVILAAGESFSVEFKRGTINDTELVEAVACLANGSGGHLLIGVENEGDVSGAGPRHGTTTEPLRLQALVAARTIPSVIATVSVHLDAGGEIIVIEVPPSDTVVGTIDGRYVRRAIDVHGRPQCLPMSPHEVLGRAGSVGAQDYAAIPLPAASRADLAPEELDRYRRRARDGGDVVVADLSDDDLLNALGLLTAEGGLRLGAVLLFGTEESLTRLVPTHEVAFQVLDGLEVRVNRIERWHLVKAMESLADLVQAYNPQEEVDVGLLRVPLPRYASETIRELISNAVVHRDYSMRGQVRVEIDDGNLSITSPGGFPEGITPDNILVAPPRPRSPLLAEAFKRAGLVDRTGRGVNRAYQGQLSLGRPAPDYSRSTQAWVEARVRGDHADRRLAAFVVESRQKGEVFGWRDLMILAELRRERRLTSARAGHLLQESPDDARAMLNTLVERGLLEARGERRARTYHLAAAVYRELGDAGAYVRTRGFDRIQQEQMILTFVARHGAITRREAADLCQLSAPQAGRMLRRMRDEGKLSLRGSRRNARYTLPGAADDLA